MPPLNHCDPCAVVSFNLCASTITFPFLMNVQDQSAYIQMHITNANGNTLDVFVNLIGGYYTLPVSDSIFTVPAAGWYNENQTWNVVFYDQESLPVSFTYQGNTYSCAWITFTDNIMVQF